MVELNNMHLHYVTTKYVHATFMHAKFPNSGHILKDCNGMKENKYKYMNQIRISNQLTILKRRKNKQI